MLRMRRALHGKVKASSGNVDRTVIRLEEAPTADKLAARGATGRHHDGVTVESLEVVDETYVSENSCEVPQEESVVNSYRMCRVTNSGSGYCGHQGLEARNDNHDNEACHLDKLSDSVYTVSDDDTHLVFTENSVPGEAHSSYSSGPPSDGGDAHVHYTRVNNQYENPATKIETRAIQLSGSTAVKVCSLLTNSKIESTKLRSRAVNQISIKHSATKPPSNSNATAWKQAEAPVQDMMDKKYAMQLRQRSKQRTIVSHTSSKLTHNDKFNTINSMCNPPSEVCAPYYASDQAYEQDTRRQKMHNQKFVTDAAINKRSEPADRSGEDDQFNSYIGEGRAGLLSVQNNSTDETSSINKSRPRKDDTRPERSTLTHIRSRSVKTCDKNGVIDHQDANSSTMGVSERWSEAYVSDSASSRILELLQPYSNNIKDDGTDILKECEDKPKFRRVTVTVDFMEHVVLVTATNIALYENNFGILLDVDEKISAETHILYRGSPMSLASFISKVESYENLIVTGSAKISIPMSSRGRHSLTASPQWSPERKSHKNNAYPFVDMRHSQADRDCSMSSLLAPNNEQQASSTAEKLVLPKIQQTTNLSGRQNGQFTPYPQNEPRMIAATQSNELGEENVVDGVFSCDESDGDHRSITGIHTIVPEMNKEIRVSTFKYIEQPKCEEIISRRLLASDRMRFSDVPDSCTAAEGRSRSALQVSSCHQEGLGLLPSGTCPKNSDGAVIFNNLTSPMNSQQRLFNVGGIHDPGSRKYMNSVLPMSSQQAILPSNGVPRGPPRNSPGIQNVSLPKLGQPMSSRCTTKYSELHRNQGLCQQQKQGRTPMDTQTGFNNRASKETTHGHNDFHIHGVRDSARNGFLSSASSLLSATQHSDRQTSHRPPAEIVSTENSSMSQVGTGSLFSYQCSVPRPYMQIANTAQYVHDGFVYQHGSISESVSADEKNLTAQRSYAMELPQNVRKQELEVNMDDKINANDKLPQPSPTRTPTLFLRIEAPVK